MCACFPMGPFILDAFQRHIYVQPIRKWNPAMTSSEYNRYGDKRRWIHNTALTKSVKNCSILYLFVRRCSAGQTGLSLRRRRSGGLTVGLQGPVTLAPPGFCNRGGVRYGSIGGLEYEVPQSRLYCLCINVALCSTALQCICRVKRRSSMTMKAHTYYIIFGRPPIGGGRFPLPPLAAPLSRDLLQWKTAAA